MLLDSGDIAALIALEAVKPPSMAAPKRTRIRLDRRRPLRPRRKYEGRPCFALADHARILLPDIVAFRLGVRPGSTRSHAFALAPRLTLLAEDIRLEKEALEAVALALLAHARSCSLMRIRCCWSRCERAAVRRTEGADFEGDGDGKGAALRRAWAARPLPGARGCARMRARAG